MNFKNILNSITVEPYLFFCLLGYTSRLVSFQNLLMDRACRNMMRKSDDICDNLESNPTEQNEAIEAGNNLYLGVMLLSSLPAIVVAILLGPWSDKYSRKYPLIFSVSGMFLEALACAILTIFPSISPVWYVVIALFSGCTGGFMISVSSAFSYLSDITNERSRPSRFAILEFSNISAIVVGNLLGGQLFQAFGYLAVMIVAPVTLLLGIAYVIIFVPETKPKVPDDRRKEMFRDLFRLDNVKMSYKTCSMKRPGNIRLQIWLLVFISCCQRFCDMGTLAAAFPFAKKMYKWNVTQFSNATIIFYVVNAIAVLSVVPFLTQKMRLHEAALGLIGIFSLLSKMIVTSVAVMPAMFLFGWISGTLGNCCGIAARSRLSKLVNKEELGRAFSMLATCESLTPILGSTIFLQIYNASIRTFPGMPFASTVVLLVPCAIIYMWMMNMPTISLADYARDEEMKTARALEPITSSSYSKLEENEKY